MYRAPPIGKRRILGAVDEQRRHPDRRQDVPDVGLASIVASVSIVPGLRAAPEIVASDSLVVEHGARAPPRRPPRGTRKMAGTPPPPGAAVLGPAPRVVGGPQAAGEAADEDERRRPLRVGRCEEQAHRHAVPALMIAARAEPAASITARTSSIRVSRPGAPSIRPTSPCRACRRRSAGRTSEALGDRP